METLLDKSKGLQTVKFPILLSHDGLVSLFKYHVVEYDEKRSIQLISDRVEEIGELIPDHRPSIERVVSHTYSNKIVGTIRDGVKRCIGFSVSKARDEDIGSIYSGTVFDPDSCDGQQEKSPEVLDLREEFDQSAYAFFEKLKVK